MPARELTAEYDSLPCEPVVLQSRWPPVPGRETATPCVDTRPEDGTAHIEYEVAAGLHAGAASQGAGTALGTGARRGNACVNEAGDIDIHDGIAQFYAVAGEARK